MRKDYNPNLEVQYLRARYYDVEREFPDGGYVPWQVNRPADAEPV